MNSAPKKRQWRNSTQMELIVTYSIVFLVLIIALTVSLYTGFSTRMRESSVQESAKLLEQTGKSLEDYLHNMRRTAYAIYYNVIKSKDIAVDSFNSEMSLLYQANRDSLVSVALYRSDGTLVAASPNAVEKKDVDAKEQEWFEEAMRQMENQHFSNPHVQNLFDNPGYQYHWVVSLSEAVNMTENGNYVPGVLLVDMSYTAIKEKMDDVNSGRSDNSYIYLTDPLGNIIYHPQQMQIGAGLFKENNRVVRNYGDGVHEETFQGVDRTVVVDTISYTGWKMVSVIPSESMSALLYNTKAFVVMITAAVILAAFLVNQIVAARISKPLIRLSDTIQNLENGAVLDGRVYDDGSLEVVNLGKAIESYISQIDRLMQDVVNEQEEKRTLELDALQSQINPHFLYNTLDSIMWMIEGEKNQEAIFMISQLAQLFRISLSQGMTMISMRDEIKHVQSYMNIQKVRYKNRFTCEFDVSEEILDCITVKLIIQPILENAIYHGVKDMEEGEIHVHGYRDGDDVYIDVTDNGYGMSEEEVARLFEDKIHRSSRGSGVGMMNVHKRIRLRFGEPYGLIAESELDVGTRIRIHIPYIPFTPDNQKKLENRRGA